MMSRIVLSQGEASRFSHVGIMLVMKTGVFVVHAVPSEGGSSGGVLMEPLSVFASLDSASEIGFYRLKDVREATRSKIRAYALRQLGKPFDDSFLLSDESKLYCTELVIRAFESGGVNIESSVDKIKVMLIAEPVVPPDYLRRSLLLEEITFKAESRSASQRH
ncbi:MAG: hypothetical protein K2Y28_04105 [Burkholderiaceae bacterium]|nr:hypothetical protein [Burkholderiaceae bacterium]